MVSYFVRYEGKAENAQAFLGYYREKHVPILARFPRIRKIILHVPAAWNDPFPVKEGNCALLAQMVFDSKRDLDAALASPARNEARGDFASFPAFGGEVFHQAMTSEEAYTTK